MTPPDELLAVADEADVALSAVQVSRLQATLDAITSASNQTRRAWSGSNIGFHAAIYTEDLASPVPTISFLRSGY